MKAFRIIFFFVAGALVLHSCKSASGDKVMLRLQPDQGTDYQCELNVDSKIKMMGMNVTSNMTMGYSMLAESVSEDTVAFKTTYERIKMEQKTPMGNVDYDTDNKDTSKSMGMMEKQYDQVFSKMIGKPFYLKMNPIGKVVGSSGMDKLFEGTNEQMAQQADMAEQMSSMTAVFPDKKVGVGDTWDAEVDASGQVPIIMKNTYTVKKITDSEVVLELKGTISLDNESPAVKQMGASEASGDISGTMTVDRASGWTKSAEMVQNMSMKMAQMGNQAMEVETNITLTTK